MTREVLVRKLARLERYLEDLRPHRGKSGEEVRESPYEDIDYEIVAASIGRALDDFGAFLEHYRGRLGGGEGG